MLPFSKRGTIMKLPRKKKFPTRHGKTRIGSIWLDLTDGGGLIISPTKAGGYVITHVPPRQPVKLAFAQSVLVPGEVGDVRSAMALLAR